MTENLSKSVPKTDCADLLLVSVVVHVLARALQVTVAFVSRGEPCLDQVLPVENAAAQLLPLCLAPGPLSRQQVDVT